MQFRPTEIIAEATAQGLDPAYALAALSMDDSIGQVSSSEEEYKLGLRSSVSTLKKITAANEGAPASTGAEFIAGPQWKQVIDEDATAMAAGKIGIVDYANKFEGKYLSFKQRLAAGEQISESDVTPISNAAGRVPDLKTMYADMNSQLNEVLRAIGPAEKKYQADTDRLNTGYTKNINEIVSLISAKSVDDAKVALMHGQIESQRGYEAQNVLTYFGINTGEADQIYAKIANRMKGSKEQKDILAAQINEKESRAFLTNPTGWLEAQFSVGADIQQHNALNAQMRDDAQYLNTAANLSKDLDTVNTTKGLIIKGASAAASADAITKAAQIESLKMKDLIIKNDMSVAGQQITKLIQHANTLNTIANALFLQDDRDSKMQAAQHKKDAEELSFQAIKIGAAQIGIAINSPADLKNLRPEQRAALQVIVNSGGTQFGDTPLATIKTLSMGDPSIMPKATSTMLEFMKQADLQAKKEIFDDVKKTGGALPAAAKYDEMRNQKITEKMLQWSENVDINPIPHRQANPYRMGDFKDLIRDPAVSKTMLGMTLQKMYEANPSFSPTGQQIATIVRDGVFATKDYPSLEDGARDIQTFFSAAVSLNNRNFNGFEAFHAPAQTSYRFVPSGGEWPKQNKSIDFTSFSEIQQWLVKRIWNTPSPFQVDISATVDYARNQGLRPE